MAGVALCKALYFFFFGFVESTHTHPAHLSLVIGGGEEGTMVQMGTLGVVAVLDSFLCDASPSSVDEEKRAGGLVGGAGQEKGGEGESKGIWRRGGSLHREFRCRLHVPASLGGPSRGGVLSVCRSFSFFCGFDCVRPPRTRVYYSNFSSNRSLSSPALLLPYFPSLPFSIRRVTPSGQPTWRRQRPSRSRTSRSTGR